MDPSPAVRPPGDRVGGGARGVCILGRVACRVGALGEFPTLSVGQPTAGGGGAPVALCPSLVGCKGQYGKVLCGYY